MHPICFKIGVLTIRWYGVLMAAGFMAGYANWVILGRKNGWRSDFLSDMLLWIMIAGILGARLAYVFSDIGYFAQHPLKILRVDEGGLIFYGGLISGLIALRAFAHVRKVRFIRLLDLVAVSMPLAHALGRIGCFMNGCCYGRVWDSPLAVHYPGGSVAWSEEVNSGLITRYDTQSLSVHPVQLYEMAFNLLLYALLVVLYRRKRKEGLVVGVYLMIYGSGRFILEFLRGHSRLFWMTLSTAQWVSLLLLIAGCTILMKVAGPASGEGGRAE